MATATSLAEPNAEAVVVMQGYLKKKSPKALGKGKVVDVWQKRFFVLTGAQLKYYKDKHGAETSTSSSREPLKMIAMAQVQSAAPNPKHLDMLPIDLGAAARTRAAWHMPGARTVHACTAHVHAHAHAHVLVRVLVHPHVV